MTRVIRAEQRGPTLIPAAVVDAHERARAILEQAQARAEQLRAEAIEHGRAQGRAELAAAQLALLQERDQLLEKLEPQVLELALLAAKHIVGHELAQRPESIVEIVASLLERVRRAHRITLRIHPDDHHELARCLDPLRDRTRLAASLQIEDDPGLCRGDCVLISDIGSLDARVETRLQALGRALGVR